MISRETQPQLPHEDLLTSTALASVEKGIQATQSVIQTLSVNVENMIDDALRMNDRRFGVTFSLFISVAENSYGIHPSAPGERPYN